MIVAISKSGMLTIAEQQGDGTWTEWWMPGNSINPDKWSVNGKQTRAEILNELKSFGDDILHDDDAQT